MKTSFFVSILFLTLTATVANAGSSDTLTQVIRKSGKNQLTVQVEKKFVGAHIEVLSATGDCFVCQTVSSRKMNLDISHVEPGTYILKIEKNGIVEKFEFVKN